ncbi:hypothetical protein Tco_1497794, partial [Tanacetum coccineum]
NEDPSWNTSFKTKRTHKTTSALEALWGRLYLIVFVLVRNIITRMALVTHLATTDRRWADGSNGGGKRISGRNTPDIATSDGAKEAVEVAEGPRMVLDVPEFSYRMVVCRSRKPFLETIMEDPIGAG